MPDPITTRVERSLTEASVLASYRRWTYVTPPHAHRGLAQSRVRKDEIPCARAGLATAKKVARHWACWRNGPQTPPLALFVHASYITKDTPSSSAACDDEPFWGRTGACNDSPTMTKSLQPQPSPHSNPTARNIVASESR